MSQSVGTVAIYVRQLATVARALVTRKSSECQKTRPRDRIERPLQLVTGSSGFSKSLSRTHGQNFGFDKWTFGDDAFFIAKNKVADVLGVADGVGGWRNYGIDPSAFPRTLMETCERMVTEMRFCPTSPANLIKESYEEIIQQKLPLMGDSGFLIIRDNEIVHRSNEQQHYFNTPFQLAVAPPNQEGQVLSDSPNVAESSSFGVKEGDFILLGTDGLFDNMNEDMLLDHISKIKDHKEENVQKTARKIAEQAHQLSFDPEYLSPFAISAINSGIDLKGGKPDDITVILARITSFAEPI
ncbi:hypothetical protein KUTeg_009966 [Tegillarca granosa]|uniref:Protein phosphatase n=1 Tax=Tegillarca granosa TaxID=220873 RepID=A0ABQ9F5D3_TEGGR|nr:hypothetical protein KUTeg_009966 [Tegillarca granosa]